MHHPLSNILADAGAGVSLVAAHPAAFRTDAAEREQWRIGQDLHDYLCQRLLGASFGAKALAGALDRESSPHAGNLHELARLINDSVLQVREISRGLHPVEFNSAGLMLALEELANRATRVTPCSFRCDRQMLVRSQDAAVNAYRDRSGGSNGGPSRDRREKY